MIKKNILLVLLIKVFLFYDNMSSQFLGSVAAGTLKDLDFGIVFLGETKEILYNNPNAAKFLIKYDVGSSIVVFAQVRFFLPNFLYSLNDKIPIEFPAAYYNFSDSPGGAIQFDPQSGFSTWVRIWFLYRSAIYIWIGGKVKTYATSEAGNYSNNIILQVDLF